MIFDDLARVGIRCYQNNIHLNLSAT